MSRKDDGQSSSKEVQTLKTGDYFGERALLTDDVRAATVTVKGQFYIVFIVRIKYSILFYFPHFPCSIYDFLSIRLDCLHMVICRIFYFSRFKFLQQMCKDLKIIALGLCFMNIKSKSIIH